MNSRARQLVLEANAAFLGLFGAVSFFVLDVRGIWFDVLTLGYVSTTLHCLFALLQLAAARSAMPIESEG